MTAPATTHSFRRAGRDDLDLLRRWLGERHVAKWWRDRDGAMASIATHIAGDDVEPLLMLLDGVPVGYLQCYPAAADPDIPKQAEGSRGIDFLIGEPSALGKGHGAALLKRFADDSLAAGVPRLVADPDGRDISSVGCLGRAGFEPVGLIGAPSARRLLMARDLIPQPRPGSEQRLSRRHRSGA